MLARSANRLVRSVNHFKFSSRIIIAPFATSSSSTINKMSHTDAVKEALSNGKISHPTIDLSKTIDPTGQSVTDIIQGEHALVETLYKQYQSISDAKQKQGIAYNIIKLLSIHAACEEMVVYPFLKNKDGSKYKTLVDHALNEHTQTKKDLYDLDNMEYGQSGYDAKLSKVIEETLVHVKEEESELLPTLEKAATPEELKQLAADFISAKSMAPGS